MPWSDPEVRKEYHKSYYQKNKEKWPAKYRNLSPEKRAIARVAMRAYSLKRNYGIDEAEYQRMFDAQGGRCGICGGDKSFGNGKLHVDHCHRTGRVRKLLCVKCNMALGWYEKFAADASAYLKGFAD